MERNGHLSESDEQLLELIQEGKVDAEIGVRLGLGTGEVRERTEALAAKLGVNGKAGLRARTLPRVSSAVSDAPMRRRSSRLKLGGGILTAAALLLAGVLIGRSTAPGSRAAVATPTRAVATHPTAVGANTAIVDGIASVDLGQFFVVPYHVNDGVTTVSQREALAVLKLKDAGFVNGGSGTEAQTPSGAVTIMVAPAVGDTRLIFGGDRSAVYSTSSTPEVLVWVTANTVAPNAPGPRYYHASVTAAGELWVSVDPIPTSAVIDINTGEAVDISKARFVGVVAPQSLWTSCDAGGLCSVSVSAGDFPVPSNGQVRCDAKLGVELLEYASGVRLQFVSTNDPPPPPCSAAPREVITNDKVVSGYYTAHAFDASGTPISIAVDGAGKVYAGVFGTTVGCPCFPRN